MALSRRCISFHCPVEAYPSLTPYKRRLQAGHADGWGLGGPHTDDGDQIPQIPNSGSNPLGGTLNDPGSNLEGGTTHDQPSQSTATVEMMCVERENNEGQEGF